MKQEALVNQVQEEILSLLRQIKRPGMDRVIWYLENSDFFSARCNSHHKFRGGLAVHSLGVYKEFKKLDTKFPEDSIRIVCLLHDICKAHLRGYNHIGKNHHGLRSAELLDTLGLEFLKGERNAILLHMHRIKEIPSQKSYGYYDLLRHYIHQCDHRDSESYPNGFDSYTTRRTLKYQIDTLLYATHRSGIEGVIDQLHRNKEVFYEAPASVKYHNNFRGGLAKHSMEVYQQSIKLYEQLDAEGISVSFDKDSIILCSLLHDVCKMDEYKMDGSMPQHTSKWKKNGPHGTKSFRRLKRWHLELTDEESKAIIWHMGAHAKDAMEEYSTTYDDVASSKLVELIHNADSIAAKKALK